MKTTKREAVKLARLWADASGLPQTVLRLKGGWGNKWASLVEPGEGEAVTVLPSYYLTFVDGRMSQAQAELRRLGLGYAA